MQKFQFYALKVQNNCLKDEKSELEAEISSLSQRIKEQGELIEEN